MRLEYAKDVYVVLSNKEIEKYKFGEFIEAIISKKIDMNEVKLITQEGQVAFREIKFHNGVFKRE